MKRHSLWIGVALGLLAACASSGDRAGDPSESGELTVEVYSGFASSAPALEPAPAHLVVDVSALQAPRSVSAGEDEQLRFAQRLVAPYVARHSGVGLESAQVHVFARTPISDSDAACPDAASGMSFAAAQALERLERELAQDDAGRHARVVLFSGFADECVPRLCEAAARIVERGAWLELAAIESDARVPACLASLRPSPQAPIPWLASWSRATPVQFSVEAVLAAGREPSVLAQGAAGTPLQVEAGLRRIRIALDPPEVVGPIQIRADQKLRIRVLDFPLSAPGERRWQVEVVDAQR